MPKEDKLEEKIETSKVEGESQVEEVPKEEHKRRIKPVIEELTETGEPVKAEAPVEVESATEISEKPTYEKRSPITEESKSDIKLFVIVAIVTAVVVAALAGGIYVYITGTRDLGTRDQGLSTSPTPISTELPEATPTSSPSADLKLSDYKVQILNGSGKIGEANKAKAMLIKAGFKVGDTGNAASFDFEETLIAAREEVPAEAIEAVKTALTDTYTVNMGEALPASSAYDIVITVGSK